MSESQVPRTRYERVLEQEVLACDDPICCCEAEPRWLLFQQEPNGELCEWQTLERVPSDEL